METKCKTCNNEPICAYCAEHLKGFSLPAENGTCDLFVPRPDEKCACECRTPAPDESARLSSPFYQTIEGMLSPDYKERFKAEYQQTKIRYERLKALNTKIEAAFRTECAPPELRKAQMPVHDCPHDLLREQQEVMGHYLHILELRAVIEGVDLECH